MTNKPWEYLITISGGGGHLSASKALEKKKSAKQIRIKVIDLMRSSASYGKKVGTFFTNIWDKAQKKGEVEKLKSLVKKEYLLDLLMYGSTIITLTKDLLSEKTLPKKIHITHPICLPAIFTAIKIVSSIRKNSKNPIESVNLYMTDFPTTKSEHFYSALKRLSYFKKWANTIILHSPPPPKHIKDVKSFWKKMTNIEELHVIEEDIPIDQNFYKDNISAPNSSCTLELLSQSSVEKKFHKTLIEKKPLIFSKATISNKMNIHIQKEDKVALVMLGSQPTHPAIIDYVEELIKIQNEAPASKKKRIFIFLGCGSLENKKNPLQEKILSLLQLAVLKPHVHLLPFTRQGIINILSRSDLTITRSGGLTTAELLAVKRKGGSQKDKRIIIHTEKPTQELMKKRPKNMNIMAWRNQVINLPWEQGNAEYLAEEFPFSVAIRGPDTIASEMKYYLFSIKDTKTAKEAKQALPSFINQHTIKLVTKEKKSILKTYNNKKREKSPRRRRLAV